MLLFFSSNLKTVWQKWWRTDGHTQLPTNEAAFILRFIPYLKKETGTNRGGLGLFWHNECVYLGYVNLKNHGQPWHLFWNILKRPILIIFYSFVHLKGSLEGLCSGYLFSFKSYWNPLPCLQISYPTQKFLNFWRIQTSTHPRSSLPCLLSQ